MNHPALLCALSGVLSSGALLAQGLPDCLVGDDDPIAEHVLRLTDRNGDGVYDSGLGAGENEAYDYFFFDDIRWNTRYRDIIEAPWAPGTLYMIDGLLGTPAQRRILTSMWDADGDGVIQQSESKTALSVDVYGYTDPEAEAMATDGVHLWFISNAGPSEGVWRCIDLNGDGDVADAGELTPAFVEAAAGGTDDLPITNTPNTTAANAGVPPGWNPSETQRISFIPEPTAGSAAPGYFVCEDENRDQILALEDLDGNGDFYGPDECRLWLAAYNGGSLVADAHPDAVGGLIPQLCAEVGTVAVDTSTSPVTCYILNEDTSGPDMNLILRGRDLNADGDVNDAGEINVFFQAMDTDPDRPMSLLRDVEVWNGDVYVLGDSLVPFEHDRILRLTDANLDGTIDNSTETSVVFDLPANRDLEQLNFFAAGVLPPPPPGLPGLFEYVEPATCISSNATPHQLLVGGVYHGDEYPELGGEIDLRTVGGPASAATALHIGTPFGVPVPLDAPANTCNLYVNPATAVGGFTTDAAGDFALPLAIPNDPGLDGASFFFETLSIDVGLNPFNVSVSNGVRIQFGRYHYTPPMNAP